MVRSFLLASAALVAVAAPAVAETILGVTAGGNFVRFDSATPNDVSNLGPVAGLTGGESFVGIDRRPNGGGIFGVTDQSRLYSIAFAGGAPVATQVGSDGAFTLGSTNAGVDFNPVPDRLRLVDSSNENLRVNPNDGTLTMNDGDLAYDSTAADGDPVDVNAGTDPNVVAAGYTLSFAPSPRTPPPGTTLYVIDSNLDILAIQAPPNDGVLNTVGSLGVDVSDITGFDISGVTNVAYLFSLVDGLNAFYTVDLATGLATSAGTIEGLDLVGIPVADVPAPASLALFGLGLAALASRRRRG